jgi:hypothetical protein
MFASYSKFRIAQMTDPQLSKVPLKHRVLRTTRLDKIKLNVKSQLDALARAESES